MAFKIARSKLTQHQRSDASSNSRCFVSAIPLHEEEAVTRCHPMSCVVLPDLTSVFAPFRNLEIEWRQGKKTLSRAEPINSRPNSKQPAKARQGLVWFSNGCHLNSSTDNLPCRVLSLYLSGINAVYHPGFGELTALRLAPRRRQIHPLTGSEGLSLAFL